MWALGSQHQREQPGPLGGPGQLGQSGPLGQSGQSLRQMDWPGELAAGVGGCLWPQRVWTLVA